MKITVTEIARHDLDELDPAARARLVKGIREELPGSVGKDPKLRRPRWVGRTTSSSSR